MDDPQREVAAFVEDHGLEAPPAHRLLDLASEVGELAKEVNESTGYGAGGEVAIASDEVGDAFFALLALADSVDIDAEDALAEAIRKYERRLETGETPGSGA